MSGLQLASPAPIARRVGSRYDYGDYGDGYDWISETGPRLGFHALSAWGLDGWDLGQWPYVSLSIGRREGVVTVLEYVEGDLTFRDFASESDAFGFLDACLFFWTEPAVEALRAAVPVVPASVEGLPDRFRGPFSWHRLNASKGERCGAGCSKCVEAVAT